MMCKKVAALKESILLLWVKSTMIYSNNAADWGGKKWCHSFVLCYTFFASMRAPQGSTKALTTLCQCWGSGWCLPFEFNHYDTICKELSELNISFFFGFFFLIACCQQTLKGLSWQTVGWASFSWSKGIWLSLWNGGRFQKSRLWCRASPLCRKPAFIGAKPDFTVNPERLTTARIRTLSRNVLVYHVSPFPRWSGFKRETVHAWICPVRTKNRTNRRPQVTPKRSGVSLACSHLSCVLLINTHLLSFF